MSPFASFVSRKVLGVVALFAVLAAVMMLTRRVDWYARFKQAEPVKAAA